MDIAHRIDRTLHSDARVVRAEDLTGGVSAQVLAITLDGDDERARTIVARLYGGADAMHNPEITDLELLVLQTVVDGGIPAPVPIRAFAAGVVSDRPSLVTSFIEGTTNTDSLNPDEVVECIAEILYAIHSLEILDRLARLLPRALLDADSLLNVEHQHQGTDVLLHGDVWPGNFIWKEGRIAGVIDWEDAKVGDARFDVANASVEFSLALGGSAGERLVNLYATRNPTIRSDLDVFELNAVRKLEPRIGGFGLSGKRERVMRDRLRAVRSEVERSSVVVADLD